MTFNDFGIPLEPRESRGDQNVASGSLPGGITEVDATTPVEVPLSVVAPVADPVVADALPDNAPEGVTLVHDPGRTPGDDALAAADALSLAAEELVDAVATVLDHIPRSKRPWEAISKLQRAQLAYVRAR